MLSTQTLKQLSQDYNYSQAVKSFQRKKYHTALYHLYYVDSPSSQKIKADCLLQLGRIREAHEVYNCLQDSIGLQECAAQKKLIETCKLLYHLGMYQEVIKKAEQHPSAYENKNTLLLIARSNQALKNYDLARKQYKKLYHFFHGDENVHYYYIKFLLERDMNAVYFFLNDSLTLRPNSKGIRLLEIEYYRKTHQWILGRICCEEMLTQFPNNGTLLFNLIHFNLLLGYTKKAFYLINDYQQKFSEKNHRMQALNELISMFPDQFTRIDKAILLPEMRKKAYHVLDQDLKAHAMRVKENKSSLEALDLAVRKRF